VKLTDIDTLNARSERLELDGIDFERFVERPLDQASLRCLRYMHDVEHHTTLYLREVLATQAHRDPEVTSFLACWVYEEHWHGEALAQVLRSHGEAAGRPRIAAMRAHLSRRHTWRPILFGLCSAMTEQVVAVHMCWGAVNEWTTQAAYGRLATRADHPVLTELLHRIMKQEGRHIDFYAGQAHVRLRGSRRAQGIARLTLDRLWAPVGAGIMPPREVAFLAHHLFANADDMSVARRVDRAIDQLPGLDGLHLLERTINRLEPA
jgi:hypothetical protein